MLRFRKNVYSQNGEDGIIQEICQRLDIKYGTFIEFGAWDGIHLSNCRNLVDQHWSGIFIESDPQKFKDLQRNYKNHTDIDLIQSLVDHKGPNTLDNLIETKSSKRSFDLISIDVDGLDFFIFDAMKKYLPKIIVIEVQSFLSPSQTESIPLSIAANNVGQPLSVMVDLAKSKGQIPVAYNGNLFLVQKEYASRFEDVPKDTISLQNEYLESFKNDHNLMQYMCKIVRKGHLFGYTFHNPEQIEHCKKLNM